MTALEQVVDLELGERSSAEIACAYRALCAAILVRTAMVAKAKAPPRKVEIDQKMTAQKWVAGGRGILSFEDVCEALDIEPVRARNAIRAYARGEKRESINKGRACSRMVFGRSCHARPTRNPRQDPPHCRMASGSADATGHRSRQPWPCQGDASGQAD